MNLALCLFSFISNYKGICNNVLRFSELYTPMKESYSDVRRIGQQERILTYFVHQCERGFIYFHFLKYGNTMAYIFQFHCRFRRFFETVEAAKLFISTAKFIGQSKKQFTIENYDSRVVIICKISYRLKCANCVCKTRRKMCSIFKRLHDDENATFSCQTRQFQKSNGHVSICQMVQANAKMRHFCSCRSRILTCFFTQLKQKLPFSASWLIDML